MLAEKRVASVKLPPRSPNLNAHAERFVRTIKESCLERDLVSARGRCGKRLPNSWRIGLPEYGALLQQLVQRAKTLDNDYETLQRLIEPPPARRPVGSEMALAPINSAATQPDEVDS
jgi:hypothetical protein